MLLPSAATSSSRVRLFLSSMLRRSTVYTVPCLILWVKKTVMLWIGNLDLRWYSDQHSCLFFNSAVQRLPLATICRDLRGV